MEKEKEGGLEEMKKRGRKMKGMMGGDEKDRKNRDGEYKNKAGKRIKK
ncbi:MAG: hypothetical protein HDS03_09700 [Bacteroides sp.]|nr:hypothetical protein [Bacteroides sp.]